MPAALSGESPAGPRQLGAQDASLAVLRDDVAQDALQVRAHLAEAEGAMELLYANTRGEFNNAKGVIDELTHD